MYHNLNWQDGQILQSTKSCYNLGNTNKCTNLQSVYSLYLILASIQNISRNEIYEENGNMWQGYTANEDILLEFKINPVVKPIQNYRNN